MNLEFRNIAQVFHVKLDMAKTLIAFGPRPTTPKCWLENPIPQHVNGGRIVGLRIQIPVLV